jgi:hypothetical protein
MIDLASITQYSQLPSRYQANLSYSQVVAKAHATTQRILALLAAVSLGLAAAAFKAGGGARLSALMGF